MDKKTNKQHGQTNEGNQTFQVPEPSHAERAKTLLHINSLGSLATLSTKHPGIPYGSVMPYALDSEDAPFFLISNLAIHTQNLLVDPHASLLIAPLEEAKSALGSSRLTLMGEVKQVSDEAIHDIREIYLSRHENAKFWVDFEDFHFYKLEIWDLYFVGGFGSMGWVEISDFKTAKPDPLRDVTESIIQHMNDKHERALLIYAKKYAGLDATQATMTSVDRLGFHLKVQVTDGVKGARIGFSQEVKTLQQARDILIQMAK